MRHLQLLLVVCCALAACSDSLPIPGDSGTRVDAATADGPSIRDTGTADAPADAAMADQGADTSSDASVPPTACIFDDPNSLFGSCLFDP